MLYEHIHMYMCGTGNVGVGIKFTEDNGEFYIYIYICICAYGLSSFSPFCCLSSTAAQAMASTSQKTMVSSKNDNCDSISSSMGWLR